MLLSHVWCLVIPWTVAHQALLSMEFSRQEYWSELPFSSPRESSRPSDWTYVSCTMGRRMLCHWATRKARVCVYMCAFFSPPDYFSLIFIFCCCVIASLKLFLWLQSVNFCPSEHILIPHLQILSACNAGDLGSIPGLGRTPGERKGNPPQYSGLENSMDCIIHGVEKSQTRLSDFHFHYSLAGTVLVPGMIHHWIKVTKIPSF